jgi:eukaryotic-like serine/threonine-protein kinase
MTDQQQPLQQYGPYQIRELIGAGSQSAVYVANHLETGQEVALRLLQVNVRDHAQVIAQCAPIIEEIIVTDIPNSVRVLDYGSHDNILYMALDLMRGGSLLQRMRRHAIDVPGQAPDLLPSLDELMDMTARIVEALDELHVRSMVHGQLDPRSILFNEYGEAFLADIGFTRLNKTIFSLETTNSLNVTKYTAPELWDGLRPSATTDQYCLACIVYELLTGKAAFDSSSIFGWMQAHVNDVVTPPHYVRKDLPSDLAMVFWQALAKPVDRRFPGITAFYDALEQIVSRIPSGQPTGFFSEPVL